MPWKSYRPTKQLGVFLCSQRKNHYEKVKCESGLCRSHLEIGICNTAKQAGSVCAIFASLLLIICFPPFSRSHALFVESRFYYEKWFFMQILIIARTADGSRWQVHSSRASLPAAASFDKVKEIEQWMVERAEYASIAINWFPRILTEGSSGKKCTDCKTNRDDANWRKDFPVYFISLVTCLCHHLA